MPGFADDPITRLAFAMQGNKGVYALLLGSGLSKSAGIKTGWDITLDLIRKVARASGVEDQANWHVWYKDKFGREPDYSDLLERLAPNPADRQPIIQAYLEPARDAHDPGDRTGRPTPAHESIAKLVKDGFIRVIITTNFDRLLETALIDVGVQPTVIASKSQCRGAVPPQHTDCTILKLHGDVLDVQSLNTALELARYPKRINQLLDRILDEYGLIVCGWSGVWDLALRAAVLRTPNRRYSTWWATRGEIESQALPLIKHRGAEQIATAGADDFFGELAERVDDFTRLNKASPPSLDLLISLTKRYLANPDIPSRLHDLWRDQIDEIVDLMTRPDLAPSPQHLTLEDHINRRKTPSAPPDGDAYRRKIQQIDAGVERLATMMYTMARWGDGSTEEIIRDTIDTLHDFVQWRAPADCSYAELALRSYPAMLCFAAISVGLVRAGRWETWRRLCDRRLLDRDEKQQTTLALLQPGAWLKQSQSFDLWNVVAPMGSSSFHRHLRELLTSWLRRETGRAYDLNRLLTQVDLLGSFLLFCQQPTASQPGHESERLELYLGPWCLDNPSAFSKLLEELTKDSPLVQALPCLLTGYVDTFKTAFQKQRQGGRVMC